MELYVARDKRRPERHDLGSALCLRVLDLLPQDTVRVHDCDTMRGAKPPWLVGTPTLATGDAEVLRGHEALLYLQRVSVDVSAQTSSKKPSSRPPSSRPPPRAAVPDTGSSPEGPSAPMAPASDDADVNETLWETRIDEKDAEESTEDALGGKKITGDDLARMAQMRAEQQRRGGVGDATAPAPLND